MAMIIKFVTLNTTNSPRTLNM